MLPVPTPATRPAPGPGVAPEAAPAWQKALGEAFRIAGDLLAFLRLDPAQAPRGLDPAPRFPLRVPRAYAGLMRRGDWNDPLLRQVLTLASENETSPGFAADAVGDGAAQDGPAVLRKYRGRALLVLTGQCAVHCRYCFRREYPYADQALSPQEWDDVYARLGGDPSVEELIFSGGDPLSLSDAKLRFHFVRGVALQGVRRLRLHTRLPVALPERVDDGLLSLIRDAAAKKPLYIVLHVNHANEIGTGLESAATKLRAAGAILLNQSVLLRGVNDSTEALEALSLRLLDAGILPYYLHQLDRVRGAHDFEVPESEGLRLMEDLRARVPGYGMPRYVREIAGENSKTLIT
jgi:EF-P beta-lysylation protein EpmB